MYPSLAELTAVELTGPELTGLGNNGGQEEVEGGMAPGLQHLALHPHLLATILATGEYLLPPTILAIGEYWLWASTNKYWAYYWL